MSPKTTRVTGEEDTRGCCGCFGWFFRLFKKKRRGNRAKHKDPEESLTLLPSTTELLEHSKEEHEVNDVTLTDEEHGAAAAAEDVGQAQQAELDGAELAQYEQEPRPVKTWAEEVDEAEELGLDVFAPLNSFLLHAAAGHYDTLAMTENEVTAAAVPTINTSTSQKRRRRRKALAAARKAAETETAAQNEASETAAPDRLPVGSMSATRRRRARRNALTARIRSEARLAANTEKPPVSSRTPVWPAPSVGVLGSDRRSFFSLAPAAGKTQGSTSTVRRRRARRKASAARKKS